MRPPVAQQQDASVWEDGYTCEAQFYSNRADGAPRFNPVSEPSGSASNAAVNSTRCPSAPGGSVAVGHGPHYSRQGRQGRPRVSRAARTQLVLDNSRSATPGASSPAAVEPASIEPAAIEPGQGRCPDHTC